LAVYSNSFLSVLYCLATSASCGSSIRFQVRILYERYANHELMLFLINLPGSGAHNSACREMSAVLMVRAGVHSFFKMSRQMAPVTELMLGCQILVMNRICICVT
jgi:hypothetical protein